MSPKSEKELRAARREWGLALLGAWLYSSQQKKNRELQQELADWQQEFADQHLRLTNPAAWEQLEHERAEQFERAEAARAKEAAHGDARVWVGIAIFVCFFIFILVKLDGCSGPLSTPTPEYKSFATPSPMAAPAPVAPETTPPEKLILMNEVRPVLENAPLYTGPDFSTPIKDYIHAGAKVRVLGKQGDFFVVRKLNGLVGFVPRTSIGP